MSDCLTVWHAVSYGGTTWEKLSIFSFLLRPPDPNTWTRESFCCKKNCAFQCCGAWERKKEEENNFSFKRFIMYINFLHFYLSQQLHPYIYTPFISRNHFRFQLSLKFKFTRMRTATVFSISLKTLLE